MADDCNWQNDDNNVNNDMKLKDVDRPRRRDDYHTRRRSIEDRRRRSRDSDRSYRSSEDSRSRRRTRSRSRSRSPSERRRNRDRSRSRSRSRSRTNSRSRSRSRSRRDERDSSEDSDGSSSAHESSSRSRLRKYESRGYRRDDARDDDFHRTGNERITGHDWRSKLTSIRDAHFNRSKQPPVMAQNQFKNDGSFMEMFKKKMAEQATSVTPNSLVLASSSIQFSPDLSLPPLTTTPLEETVLAHSSHAEQDLDGVPMPAHKSIPVPVSVGKRRLAKPLKTGIVLKKPQEPTEDEASQEKLDAWARYLQEVQKYKSANCMDDDNSRPLVK
ncbi:arginine/serine-rich coiled-coil protein 2 [Biomphalaria glabrata]|nr:arginine/serine-rich coiled-coil protein 2 [Biomphalaria glabrata]